MAWNWTAVDRFGRLRGLARHMGAYRTYLARADDPPQGALDGRGILSDGRLAKFCLLFLAACLDQVRFMQALLAAETLTARMREFVAADAAEGRLDLRVTPLLERAVLFGEVPRGETERFFPHLWAPSALGTVVEPALDIRDALQPPRAA